MHPHQQAALSVTPSPTTTQRTPGRFSRILGVVLFTLVAVLLFEVLFEGWIQIRFGERTVQPNGSEVVALLDWPKTLKNGLYVAIALLSALKITVDRRWRDFRTMADIALVVLVVILVLAGIVGDSSFTLMGESLFVYFRGAVIFYAWRALNPSWQQFRIILWILGGVVLINVVIALVEMFVGEPVYRFLGWTDLKWARTDRAHALLTHPNHLGHILSLAILFITGWLVSKQKLNWKWWGGLTVLALALSASQSRESLAAVVVGAAVIWFLAKAHFRRVLAVVIIIGLATAAQVVVRPSNLVEWERRALGVVDAFRVPSGSEPTPPPAAPGQKPNKVVPDREIRVLFYQQGLDLWTHQPILGYGIGQFGGIVAQENNPNWHLDPQFGPEGFDRHGFKSVQVDSFWLHLTVEAGTLGLLGYLAWLFFLILPLLRRTPRMRGPGGADLGPEGLGPRTMVFSYWAVSAVFFAVMVAFLSASLEDPMLPPILFTCLGLAWMVRRTLPEGSPGSGEDSQRATVGAS